MRHYTDEEIKELFPGLDGEPIAEIVPKTRMMRVMSDPPPKHANNGFFEDTIKGSIVVKHNRQTGNNPFTGEPIYQMTNYSIGPFEVGQRIRTDKIPRISQEIPPCELIRLLLNHDSHKDENGNVLVFDVCAVEPELLAMEAPKNKGGRPRKEVVA